MQSRCGGLNVLTSSEVNIDLLTPKPPSSSLRLRKGWSNFSSNFTWLVPNLHVHKHSYTAKRRIQAQFTVHMVKDISLSFRVTVHSNEKQILFLDSTSTETPSPYLYENKFKLTIGNVKCSYPVFIKTFMWKGSYFCYFLQYILYLCNADNISCI